MKISALGIGTELTSGQILNRNGQWISQKLKELGVITNCHLVVPDDKELIIKALSFCAKESSVLFVTGGLGPTTDDFTRDVIAEWAGLPLEYDEKSWQHIESILLPRGIPLRAAQKQQCYYPHGSTVFTNPLGTANAFYFKKDNLDVYVLPGPPKEIEAIWHSEIEERLRAAAKNLDPYLTFSWDCIGLGESEIAHITETTIQHHPLEKGYRVHLPYVEVKMSCYKSELSKYDSVLKDLDKNLSPYTVTKNGQNLAELLAEKLKSQTCIYICDEVSGSYLLNRIIPAAKELCNENKIQFLTSHQALPSSLPAGALILRLSREEDISSAKATVVSTDKNLEVILKSPYTASAPKDRAPNYFAEAAMVFWLQFFS